MKHVVEYKLHGGAVPYFIEDGGYFWHEGRMIGLTKDDVNCYVPPSSQLVTVATKADFANYVAALTIHDMLSQAELTEQQKRDMADAWWDARH